MKNYIAIIASISLFFTLIVPIHAQHDYSDEILVYFKKELKKTSIAQILRLRIIRLKMCWNNLE